MNKSIRIAFILLGGIMFAACGHGNPYSHGREAGKQACDCQKMDSMNAISDCLERLEAENQEYWSDTTFLRAMEEQQLECLTEGVKDIVKPIKEKKDKIKDTTTIKE